MLSNAARIARQVTALDLDPVEPTRIALRNADERNPRLLALRNIDREAALQSAHSVATRARNHEALPLAGVPVVIKDNIAQHGRVNDAGRRAGCGAPEAQDALLLRRLVRAGAVLIGRANMDELAYGVSGTNPHTGQIRNPWHEDRHPGGSSAGSAAAVASSMAALAVGTDTAGSVRIPAALCGLVGLRPTPGLLPIDGVAPLAPSFDSPGPIGNNVADVALMLSVMADQPTLANAPTDRAIDPRQHKVAALRGAFATPPSDAVLSLASRAVECLVRLGVPVHDTTIPALADAPRASGPVIGAEASYAWKQVLAEHPEGFGQTATGHLLKGATLTAVRYLQAQSECRRVAAAIHAALLEADLLVLPTTTTVATDAVDPGPQLVFLALTVPFSISGTPALTVPMGLVGGLPAGLQLVARPGCEALLLRVAHELEQTLDWRHQGN